MSFLAVLLVKNAPANPTGLPQEWHVDARRSGPELDPGLASLGYQLMSETEFEQRQKTLWPVYLNWMIQAQQAREAAAVEQQSEDDIAFTQLQSISDGLKSAEKVDVQQLSTAVGAIIDRLLKQGGKI